MWESWAPKKSMLLNCGVGEDSWGSLGLQGDPTSPSWSPDYSLEGLMLKLKLQADSFEKTLMLRKIECRRRRGWQRMRWLDGITYLMDVNLSKLWELWWIGKPGVLQSMGSHRVGHDWGTELNWTERPILSNIFSCAYRPFAYLLWRNVYASSLSTQNKKQNPPPIYLFGWARS